MVAQSDERERERDKVWAEQRVKERAAKEAKDKERAAREAKEAVAREVVVKEAVVKEVATMIKSPEEQEQDIIPAKKTAAGSTSAPVTPTVPAAPEALAPTSSGPFDLLPADEVEILLFGRVMG